MASLLLLLIAAAAAESPPAAATSQPSPFDDPVTPFVPASPPGELTQARIKSAALYAEGRLFYRRREFPDALRRMQRAWRYNPQAVELLPEIIFLANNLHRTDETARYALIAAGKTEVDPLVLRSLALRLSGQQRWQEALRIYELVLRERPVSTEPETIELGDALLYFDVGRICFLMQDFARASEYFSRIQPLLESPEKISENATLRKMLLGQPEQTYRLLAESYLAVGKCDAAEAMFRKAHEAQKDDCLLDIQLARVAARRGDDEQALQLVDRCLTKEPSKADDATLQLLAELLEKKDGPQAEAGLFLRLEPIAKAEDAPATLLQFLGHWQQTKERWDEAERWYAPLLEKDPDAQVFAGLAEVYLRKREPTRLLDTLGEAAAAGILLQDLGNLGEPLFTDVAMVDDLLAETRRRLQADREATALTGVPMAAVDLAVAARRYEVADELFDVALQWKEDEVRARALLNWGVDLLIDRQYERAVQVFRRGAEDKRIGDREDVCRYYLVRALAWAGEIDEALQTAEAAASASSDALRLQSLPGWVLYFAKRYDQAEAKYLTVLDRFEEVHDNPAVREELRDVRSSLSNLCVQMGRNDEAEEWLEQVLDEFPEDIGALNDLGYLWADQGENLERAQEMIQKAVDGDPENAAYMDSLGWVYFRRGQYEDALRWLEKAAADDDPDGVILDHLGDAYGKAGKREKALDAWHRAVRAFEESKDSAKRDATLEKIKNHEKGGE